MRTVNIHEAKTNLSRLIEQVTRGESFVIAKAGKPMAKVVPLEAGDIAATPRIGFMAGEITVPDDFDRMGRDRIEELFEGGA
ncbi:type II toxin-antitoxin system prevent-host-death family antitoxin [Skermanella mucosa]|uniref:type II toxin-antitoxin system Phd/YefM family antitoxin n=1 Tax=Skermanella mucosa TaxID=1789672 RepID=UPI00192C9BEF|nr:type II toxin-antitoxin system prevent-host-death family antitoxin [Skermanella mucosa]UEM18508.1 type II toxin-antitoxin system prevent-host-death family antitoxin [Skermanella mucosa]